ncbi:MAG TPA: type 1 glutamine amidotransferase [Candidatus Saccharimonadales bacterium]|nr:type 1 glutamine amidotransferase [Candidatus Saccharimonadales bacterium]
MNALSIPAEDLPCINALRELIRSGITAAPRLEHSPLIALPAVQQRAGAGASPAKQIQAFAETMRHIISERLEGKDAQTAPILFGIDEFAGMPIQDRYRLVAKLFHPHWTWENYRKEPLTRHLLAIYLALRREAELFPITPQPSLHGKVLIVKNISYEGPGLLQRLLNEVAIGYDIIDLSLGDVFPDPTQYAALIVMGGPDSANDNTPEMQAERNQVAKAFEAGIPYLGICLGLQVAAKVMGGAVVPGIKEVGLHATDGSPYSVSLTDLALTALGKKDPLFVGLQDKFRVFQLHGEMVELAGNMQLLATGRDCKNQIVKFRRNAYGIQSHFELTREMLEVWLAHNADLQSLNNERLRTEFASIEEVYTLTGLALLRNFLHIAGLLG